MKKIVVSVLLLSFSFITMTAQSNEATLIFKDGSKISGLGKLTNAKTIKFRKTKKDKRQVFTFKEVDTLKVNHKYGTTTYAESEIENRDEPEVLEVIMVSNSIAYYQKFKMGAPGRSSINYYLRRKTENRAVNFGSNQLVTRNFKKVAKTFFSDCKELVQAIEDEKYGRFQLTEIIEFYEEECK